MSVDQIIVMGSEVVENVPITLTQNKLIPLNSRMIFYSAGEEERFYPVPSSASFSPPLQQEQV